MNLLEILFLIFIVIFDACYLFLLSNYVPVYKKSNSPFYSSWLLSTLISMYIVKWSTLFFIVVNILAFFIIS